MKNKLLSTVVLVLFSFTSVLSQSTSSEVLSSDENNIFISNYQVKGNCGKCNIPLEKEIYGIQGVSSVKWDEKHKTFSVGYDKNITNDMSIHISIASLGYDTNKLNGDEKVRKKQPKCCKKAHKKAIKQRENEMKLKAEKEESEEVEKSKRI
ncbi:MAG: hypothetical protein HRT66_06720 [Flavobacteriaceae bacterium]|nr:hypothetical protein [Flavobacteriaceae bacterium]